MLTPRGLLFLALSVFIATVPAPLTLSAADPAESGTTQILQWKDGKKAVIMLGFDDSAPSQLEHVVPELEKRKIIGTFYLVTGNKLYAALQRRWEAAAKSPYVVVANHTFTHKGVTSAAELEPALYDLPLTLSTRIPSDWKSSVVTQGTSSFTVAVRDGAVQYDALPGGVVTLKRAE